MCICIASNLLKCMQLCCFKTMNRVSAIYIASYILVANWLPPAVRLTSHNFSYNLYSSSLSLASCNTNANGLFLPLHMGIQDVFTTTPCG